MTDMGVYRFVDDPQPAEPPQLTMEALIARIEAWRPGRIEWMIGCREGTKYGAIINDFVVEQLGNGQFQWGCDEAESALAALTAAAKEAGII